MLALLDKIQPAALILSIFVGLLIAQQLPWVSQPMAWVVPVGVFVVIYSVFISTEVREVINAFKNVKSLLLAIFLNFALVPPYVWFLGYVFLANYPDAWVGLLLYLIPPCIGWYLAFTNLAGGNVPLGVSLLGWNVSLQIVLMPIYLYVFAGSVISVDLLQILTSVGMYLVLPFALGWVTRRLIARVRGVDYFQKSVKPQLSVLRFAAVSLVIVAMFSSQGGRLLENPLVLTLVIPPALVYFFSTFALSLALGRLFKLPYGDVALLSFTTTAKNSEASLAIAISAFPANPLVAMVVAIGPAIELPMLVLFLQILLWVKNRW